MNKPTPPEMKRLTLFVLILAAFGGLSAQDLHYSQFYNSPLNINPANTGIFNGDHRINLSYRNQWTSVVPWTTFSGSYDRKFYPKKDRKYFLSGGVLMNYDDQSNISNLSLFNFNVTGSYTYILNDKNLITGGLLMGFASRAFDPTTRTWDSQWNGRNFDPTRPPELIDVNSQSFFESGIGVNYRWQNSRRTKLDLGLGVYHFIEPNLAFINADEINLPRRFSLTGVGNLFITEKFDIQLQALGQFQNEYDEFQFGGLGKFYVNQNRGKELEVHFGLGYRTTKSLFPIFAIQYKNFYGSVNYDIDLSDFDENRVFSNPQTIEFHFSYIISNVRPFKKVKVCPIF